MFFSAAGPPELPLHGLRINIAGYALDRIRPQCMVCTTSNMHILHRIAGEYSGMLLQLMSSFVLCCHQSHGTVGVGAGGWGASAGC